MSNGVNRKAGIIHCQFRLGCSDLKAHLFNLHVVDDPYCICSDLVEDCNHFFFHCRLYEDQRVILFANLAELCPDRIFSIDMLLHGCDNFSDEQNLELANLVEIYISDSSRF